MHTDLLWDWNAVMRFVSSASLLVKMLFFVCCLFLGVTLIFFRDAYIHRLSDQSVAVKSLGILSMVSTFAIPAVAFTLGVGYAFVFLFLFLS